MNDGLFAFWDFDLLQIELQLLALEHIALPHCPGLEATQVRSFALLELLLLKTADLGILFPFVIFLMNFL